jgi:hypothetical protein
VGDYVTSIGDEPTSDFGGALEDTSIRDCRLFRPFAEISRTAILGVLQHYPEQSRQSIRQADTFVLMQ